MENPFDTLINACHDDSKEIEVKYSDHRANRNTQQKAKLFSPDFPGMNLDLILQKLHDQTIEPGFTDHRNCLVFWARPPSHIKRLVEQIQAMLKDVAPHLWLMPQDHLHLTVLEVTHSLNAPEISSIVDTMSKDPDHVKSIVDYTYTHRARLHKPLLSYDDQGIALTFLPKPDRTPGKEMKGQFTYHHLRRDIYNLSEKAGATIECRYIAPSSHITVGRFIDRTDFQTDGKTDQEKIERWVAKIEEINVFLAGAEVSGVDVLRLPGLGEWQVGEEKGLDYRRGTLWYGGGESLANGKGF